MERGILDKNQLISSLIRIGHGELDIFRETGLRAACDEPEMFAHFISWNSKKGKVRDSKVAFPICALRHCKDYAENAVANLCLLDPKDFLRAVDFNQHMRKTGHPINSGAGKILKRGTLLYLTTRGERALLSHRKYMKNLYKAFHIKPTKLAQKVLFDKTYPKGSVFEAVANLKNMSSKEAAGTILNFNIPVLVAIGALGGIKNKPDIILALIEQMTGNQLMNMTNALTDMGVFENPILSEAYNDAVERAKSDKRTTTLKGASFKAKSVKASKKLISIQDEKLKQLGGIDGDWLVLADKSSSMLESIEVAKEVASLISQQVSGKVYLIFFHTAPQFVDVSGLSLEEIKAKTKGVRAGGCTSIGVGLDYILQKGIFVNGIFIVSDGGENTYPSFYQTYDSYVNKFGINPTVYHLVVRGDYDRLVRDDFNMDKIYYISKRSFSGKEVIGKETVDYYSLPNLVMSIRANRYSFIDDIMEAPLLTFSDVFGKR